MSTPMFIREPQVGISRVLNSGTYAITGADPTAGPGPGLVEIMFSVEEATLIEQIRYSAKVNATDAGQLLVGIQNEDYASGAYVYTVGCFEVSPGVASPGPFTSGVIELGITLQPGFSLLVAHNILKTASYQRLDITAWGGAVR